jgi:hypothetical protein
LFQSGDGASRTRGSTSTISVAAKTGRPQMMLNRFAVDHRDPVGPLLAEPAGQSAHPQDLTAA